MHTHDNTAPEEGAPIPTDRRPLGAWLRLVENLLTREFAEAFATEDVTRRDWMLLTALSRSADAPWTTERLARHGKCLHRLAERGWITRGDAGVWQLTDDGLAAKARLGERVQAVRERLKASVGDGEYSQLKASLRAMAEGMGWDASQPMPHHGHGRRGRCGRGRSERRLHPGLHPEFYGHAYERGLTAGFDRGFDRGLSAGARVATPPTAPAR